MKKAIVILAVMGVALLFALPELTAQGARYALDDYREKTWAPGVVYWAGRVNMRMWRDQQAGALLGQGLSTWPNAYWKQEGHYYVALCHERQRNNAEATRWYNTYLTKYPNHRWSSQAQKRLSNMETNE